MKSPILMAGLARTGKTTFLCSLLRLARKKKQKDFAGFKPFDTGLVQANAQEKMMDGEIIAQNMANNPNINLISPYLAHENYPIQMAFQRDGIRIDWNHLLKHLLLLGKEYEGTLIELPPSLYTPLTKEKILHEWLQETWLGESQTEVIWLMTADPLSYEHNWIELEFLLKMGFKVQIVLNNTSQILDQDLLFFVWEKTEKLFGKEICGMLPFLNKIDQNFDEFDCNVEENIPDLLEKVIGMEQDLSILIGKVLKK